MLEPEEQASAFAKASVGAGGGPAAAADAMTASEWLMVAFKKMVANQVSFTPQGRALQRDVSV